jgi:hypothetical protein
VTDNPSHKACRDCQHIKPLSEFHLNATRPDGRGLYCKSCTSIRQRQFRERKAQREGRPLRPRVAVDDGMKRCPRCELVLPRDRFGRNRSSSDGLTAYCRDCHNAIGKRNRESRHGSTREYHLRRRYGIGAADVDGMIQRQGGVCAACRVDPPSHVDHDHATGRVRGVLCFLCNQALGNVRDDVSRLYALIHYLDRSRRLAALEATMHAVEAPDCCVIEVAGALHRAA